MAERARSERLFPCNRAGVAGQEQSDRAAIIFPAVYRAAHLTPIPIRSGRCGRESRSLTFAPNAIVTVWCEFMSPRRPRARAGAFTLTMNFNHETLWTSVSWEFRLRSMGQGNSRVGPRRQSA